MTHTELSADSRILCIWQSEAKPSKCVTSQVSCFLLAPLLSTAIFLLRYHTSGRSRFCGGPSKANLWASEASLVLCCPGSTCKILSSTFIKIELSISSRSQSTSFSKTRLQTSFHFLGTSVVRRCKSKLYLIPLLPLNPSLCAIKFRGTCGLLKQDGITWVRT